MKRSIWDAAERLLASQRDYRRTLPDRVADDDFLIRTRLPIAEGLIAPTCADVDEPQREAEQRKERHRVIATRLLLAIYREQIEEERVDPRLRRFFVEQAERRVWCSRDPFGGLRGFLGPLQRGASIRHAMRDFDLAADIQQRRDSGQKLGDACLAVFEEIQGTDRELDPRTLQNIYFRETKHPVDKAAVAAWAQHKRGRHPESR